MNSLIWSLLLKYTHDDDDHDHHIDDQDYHDEEDRDDDEDHNARNPDNEILHRVTSPHLNHNDDHDHD